MRLMLAGLAGLLALGLSAAEPSGEGNGATLLGKKPYGIDGRMHLYRDFAYGSRPDLPGEGDRYPVWRDFKGAPFHTHRSGQLFDVYLPDALGKVGVESASRFCWFRFHGQFNDRQLEWISETCADFAKRHLN